MNLICLGGRVLGTALAWELAQAFLSARFSGADRHRRRLAMVRALEEMRDKGSSTVNTNPLRQLTEFGQSIWLDYIRRQMLASGELTRLIEDDGLRGVTSNPKIFKDAIAGSPDYDDAVGRLSLEGKTAEEIYTHLSVEDVQNATDCFRALYDASEGRHGFVSLEVSPRLAYDTEGTVAEARKLWNDVNRPNVLIKVPGTREGLPAIRQLIREGINVNVTLLFGLSRYREVAEAYLGGLEDRLADGHSLGRVASVASFFLSRIDVLVDPLLEEHFDAERSNGYARQRVARASRDRQRQIGLPDL